MISTIWREALPPPRRPLTTSLGVINLGLQASFGGGAAFRDFTSCFRGENGLVSGG